MRLGPEGRQDWKESEGWVLLSGKIWRWASLREVRKSWARRFRLRYGALWRRVIRRIVERVFLRRVSHSCNQLIHACVVSPGIVLEMEGTGGRMWVKSDWNSDVIVWMRCSCIEMFKFGIIPSGLARAMDGICRMTMLRAAEMIFRC